MAELREMNLQEVGRLFGVEVSESETYIFLWAHQDYGARGMMLGLSVPSQWFNWRGRIYELYDNQWWEVQHVDIDSFPFGEFFRLYFKQNKIRNVEIESGTIWDEDSPSFKEEVIVDVRKGVKEYRFVFGRQMYRAYQVINVSSTKEMSKS